MSASTAVELGRESIERQAWGDAFEQLSAADREASLGIDDLERLAVASYMAGKDYECATAWTRAHHQCIRENDLRRAARCAFWQACGLLFRGRMAPAMGWIARGRRTLENCAPDCPEQAWLLALTGLPIMFEGDPAAAMSYFDRATEIANPTDDHEVVNFVRLTRGTALVMMDDSDGLPLLDETMIAVISGEVSPILAGIAYCQVISLCQEIFDLRRAREWTEALTNWCDTQTDLVPYRGNCLVHQCEVLRLQGAWPAALEAAQKACERLGGPTPWDTLGSAYYELAEVHRLRGELRKAEQSYRHASQAGRDPEPGMSLLRLADGNLDMATASIRRVANEVQGPARARILAAFVEIMVETDDVKSAAEAAHELERIAAEIDAPFLHALSSQASGAVLLAKGDATAALDVLRRAQLEWQQIDAPYESARVRALIGLACQTLGDSDSASMERDAARSVFERLGAKADLRRLEPPSPDEESPGVALTTRQRDVLVLLAKGKTNREISAALFISEYTVARHVQNIFAKLGVSSRSAATAFAFEHNLV